jgi:hypothetical protein
MSKTLDEYIKRMFGGSSEQKTVPSYFTKDVYTKPNQRVATKEPVKKTKPSSMDDYIKKSVFKIKAASKPEEPKPVTYSGKNLELPAFDMGTRASTPSMVSRDFSVFPDKAIKEEGFFAPTEKTRTRDVVREGTNIVSDVFEGAFDVKKEDHQSKRIY